MLAGGGAFGALLTIVYQRWNQRQQPISYHVSVDSIFSSAPHRNALQAIAQVTYETQTFKFDELALVRVDLKNTSNRDLETFLCGITLAPEHSAVLAVCEGRDRHHQISEQGRPLSPAAPNSNLDVQCTPFNRGDEYSVRIYVRNKGPLLANQVTPTTPAPVRFIGTEGRVPRKPSVFEKAAVTLIVLFACGAMIALVAGYKEPTFPDLVKKQNAFAREMEQYVQQLREIEERLDKISPADKAQNRPKINP